MRNRTTIVPQIYNRVFEAARDVNPDGSEVIGRECTVGKH